VSISGFKKAPTLFNAVCIASEIILFRIILLN
jgi:hypothetical protein